MAHSWRPLAGAFLGLGAGCGGTEPSPPPLATCAAPQLVSLAPGQHTVVDLGPPTGCIRLPEAGAGGASHLVALVSAAGQESQSGVSSSYHLQVGAAGTVGPPAVAPPAASLAVLPEAAPIPVRFHHLLRQQEEEFAGLRHLHVRPPDPAAALAPPVVGTERAFTVCRNLQCNQFDTVTAVARAVGTRVAVYLDKAAPAVDPLQQEDLEEFRRTFDLYHHPIVTQAFGTESDLDGNGVVIVLLTPAVNRLTQDCSRGIIFGYFWPGDLLTIAGSNRGEVFYALVPAPVTGNCPVITRTAVRRNTKPVMIHEFQHMVNYNQRVLVRSGQSEEIWLNEALSHYAEELGGRLIPGAECPEVDNVPNPCRSLYLTGNLRNLYDYLTNTESHHLVFPRSSTGTLPERGAGWTFLRWLADHFGADSVAFDLTRRLTQTTLRGGANVQAATGAEFARSVGEWFLAAYLDDLPEFVPINPRLTFRWWNFRAVFAANCCVQGAPFAAEYPFAPQIVSGPFVRSGTLRGGSGRHFEIQQGAGGGAFDVLVARAAGGAVLDAGVAARLAIARLR
jgi:hypothetical protein